MGVTKIVTPRRWAGGAVPHRAALHHAKHGGRVKGGVSGVDNSGKFLLTEESGYLFQETSYRIVLE